MRLPHIPDSQMELLAERLGAAGVGRRDFLKVAAGLATLGAAGFNARPVSAAPTLAPGEKLAKEQHLRMGGGGVWFRFNSTSSFSTSTHSKPARPILTAASIPASPPPMTKVLLPNRVISNFLYGN